MSYCMFAKVYVLQDLNNILVIKNFHHELRVLTLGRQLFATPGAPSEKRQKLFFKNSGHRFLTDISIQYINNMKNRLTIKNNQRTNFRRLLSLKSYCKTLKSRSKIFPKHVVNAFI